MTIDLKQILNNGKVRTPTEIECDSLGGSLYIASLEPRQAILLQSQVNAMRSRNELGESDLPFFCVAWTVCDESNNRLFDSGPDPETVTKEFRAAMDSLNKLDAEVFTKLAITAMSATGFAADAKKN